MVSDKVKFDLLCEDSEDNNSYKSYFARSMAVNAQYRENRLSDSSKQLQQQRGPPNDHDENGSSQKATVAIKALEPPELLRLRKDLQIHSDMSMMRQSTSSSWGSANSSRRASLCSTRLPDAPVENFFLQSQIDTLQWQLRETESSREMYRAVMRQVVAFLERAHRSLELLGTRINTRVPRTQSEYYMNTTISENGNDVTLTNSTLGPDASAYKDISWRRLKKPEPLPDEIPPEKLSQEAFRLLRTAQSLLSTHEPDLAHVTTSPEDDLNFLTQLAKEFPSSDIKPQRTTSFSLSPKLLTPDKEIKTFNRKYSLQLNDNLRRNSFLKDVSSKLNRSNESSRSSVAENDCILSSTLIDDNRSIKSLGKFKYEKSSSPPVSSVGSAEDESGFSSMNSFQEVGLPMVANDEGSKDGFSTHKCNHFYNKDLNEQIKLWDTPNIVHKRWSSTPVDNLSTDKATMKVLWV